MFCLHNRAYFRCCCRPNDNFSNLRIQVNGYQPLLQSTSSVPLLSIFQGAAMVFDCFSSSSNSSCRYKLTCCCTSHRRSLLTEFSSCYTSSTRCLSGENYVWRHRLLVDLCRTSVFLKSVWPFHCINSNNYVFIFNKIANGKVLSFSCIMGHPVTYWTLPLH